jgi:hypothetical protein
MGGIVQQALEAIVVVVVELVVEACFVVVDCGRIVGKMGGGEVRGF